MSLRAPVPGDRQRWLEVFGDPDELAYGLPAFITAPTRVEDLDERIAEAARQLEAVTPGGLSIVASDAPDRFLGIISWRQTGHPELGVADIGYAVHADSRGRGVARAAISLFYRWLTADPDGPHLARVQLDHSVENPASCRAASAAGFAKEGIRRGFLPLRDPAAPGGVRRHDVCLHGRVFTDD